jgi:SAM-dependent methyltransferase
MLPDKPSDSAQSMAFEFPLQLLAAIMQETPAQPATNFWRAAELTALIDHALPRLQDCRTLLDLGCGDGGIMAVLRPHLPSTMSVTGLDADPAETALAERRGLFASVLTSGAERMPLADSGFDAILSNSVLEHITPVDAVLNECGRLLRPGGWFVATVPGPDFHRCLRGAWLPWVTQTDYERDLDQRLAHRRYWTSDEWRRHMAAAGLVLTETINYLPAPFVRRWEFLSRLTGGLVYHLAGKKMPPIRLQRTMGLRRRARLPKSLMYGLSWILSRGLRSKQEGPWGGLLVIGRKT